MFLPANITLKFGDSGDFVSELQRRLAAVNVFNLDSVNGFFDGVTVNGVSAFQSMNGLRADGIAGPETLRRLNGVISGDTSSTNTHQEDQDRLLQEEAARQIAQQEAFARQQQHEQERLAAEQLAAEQARQAQQWQHAQPTQQAEIQHLQEAAYAPQQNPVAQQMAAEAAHLAAQQQQAALAQQHAMAHQVAAPVQQQPLEQHHQQAPQQLQPQAHAMAAHQPQQVPQQQHIPAPQSAAAAAAAAHMAGQQNHQAAPQQAVATQAEPPQKGIVGRAMQYANEMVQKLSNYFESKLRPDVIDEVKAIGQTMAKSGVKEVSIPTGPEPQRGVDTPARGPQQQQTPQRS